ncbi:uncharacterized protein DS421_19g673250 [Arachis hypogaea]|uniref:Uncharacterized protein n=1 Tax=Arachis hypogaea TaxID=3818 RepID=A0A6B9VGZ5_ARAHY|nr:uncharacterized protein DS421_19g673250 [Arachis hypogaea]
MWRFNLGCLSMERPLVGAWQSLKNSWRVADQFRNGFRSYSVSCHRRIRSSR